jgi:hypothetical protein
MQIAIMASGSPGNLDLSKNKSMKNESISVKLESGLLNLHIHRSLLSWDSILDFASRENSKRGFLLVSKILGRHLPVRPRVLQEVAEILASNLLSLDLPPPILFVAMAETATLLGSLIYEFSQKQGGKDLGFLQTSRYPVGAVAICSSEPHSHAPIHYLHFPEDEDIRRIFLTAKTLVLIDDEITSGTTLQNLSQAYRKLNPGLLEERWVALSSFMPCQEKRPVALLHGEMDFVADPGFAPCPEKPLPLQSRPIGFVDPGRKGYRFPPCHKTVSFFSSERVLVLGTGEFTYLPFQIARSWEASGAEVFFQAISRSPIRVGGAIHSRIVLDDPYGQGVPHFLYNVRPGMYDRIMVLAEPGAAPALPEELLAHVEEVPCGSWLF